MRYRWRKKTAGNGQAGGSPAFKEWLNSDPPSGDAFVDTGLASAADCRKLQWSPDKAQQALLSRLMKSTVERDRALFESGDLEAEARRINDLAAQALKQAGLEPERFGVSPPGQSPLPAEG
jgi:hypothetical protein